MQRRLLIAVSYAVAIAVGLATTLVLLRFRLDYETVYELPAGLGPLIKNLVEDGRYEVFNSTSGYWEYASKMPSVPVIYAGLWGSTKSVALTLLAKNVVAITLTFLVVVRYAAQFDVGRRAFLGGMLLFFCIPFNALTMYNLKYEEGLLAFMIPAAVACTIMRKGVFGLLVVSALLGVLYLTKSSTGPLCVWLGAVVLFDEVRCSPWVRFLPLTSVALAAVLWGAFNFHQTGEFAVAGSASSNNGWNLYKGNNEEFASVYPERHLDELSSGFRRDAPAFRDEWESHRYYEGKAFDFIQGNPRHFASNTLLKLYVFALRIADFDFNRNRVSKIVLHDASMVVNRLVFFAALALSLLWLKRTPALKNRRLRFAALVFLGSVATYSAPYILGFIYQRHVVPLFLSATLMLMLAPWKPWQGQPVEWA